MRVPTMTAALALLPVLAAGATAQTYTLKLKEYADKGEAIHVSRSQTTNHTTKVSVNGKVLKVDKGTDGREEEYTEKTLEAGAKRPAKFERTYTKAGVTQKGQSRTREIEGKTVRFEWQGDEVKATAEGVSQKELTELSKKFRDDIGSQALLPKKAVKVSETWAIDQEAMTQLLGEEMGKAADLRQAKAHGKLARAYKKGNQQWGVLEVTMDVPLKNLGGLPLTQPVPLNGTFRLDTAIDGSSPAGRMTGTIALRGTTQLEQKGQTFVVEFDIQGTMRQEQTEKQ